jgi:hypothetical protein
MHLIVCFKIASFAKFAFTIALNSSLTTAKEGGCIIRDQSSQDHLDYPC